MHYYQFHIADYRSATKHLCNEQDLAYRRLIEMYYDTEKPIPNDMAFLARRIQVDIQHIEIVLEDFFTLEDGVWRKDRCDKEIAEYHAKSQQASKAGKASAQARLNKRQTDVEHELNYRSTNHKPITINHKPIIKPSVGFDEFWDAYPRKIGKGAAKAVWDKKQPTLQIVLSALEWQCKSDGWTKDGGKFIPHPTTWLNQERWLDENPNDKPFDLHRWNLEVQGLI